MTMPDLIQPKQPRREFKNYSGNFMNIRLTARTWHFRFNLFVINETSATKVVF
jgi:hypothetical protein